MILTASYMMLDDETFDSLFGLDNETLLERVNELEEAGIPLYSVDKLWDGLHFLLTGTTASTPLEGDELSEAIVGTAAFNEDDDEADFIASTEAAQLADIIDAMKEVDIEKLTESADFNAFRKEEIYPDIWHEKDAESLRQELMLEFSNLLAFYERAEKENANILISIF